VAGYQIALTFHFLSLLLATVAAALSTFGAVRLRQADSIADATSWLAFVGKVVRAFPIAIVGLLASGAYMTHQRWSWSVPWIDAALVGLGLIIALGTGIDRARGQALSRALAAAGMSPGIRRLLRDPVAWTARITTLTLVVAVVFVMTVKPAAGGCVAAIIVAVAGGAMGAVPLWRAPASVAAEVVGSAAT
jgi:hypothetical protein